MIIVRKPSIKTSYRDIWQYMALTSTRHKSIHQLPRDAVETIFSTDSLISLVGSPTFLVDPPIFLVDHPITCIGEYL